MACSQTGFVNKSLTPSPDTAPKSRLLPWQEPMSADRRDNNMADKATFDGIICLGGEDWWYHNRGHFDFQIMRRLGREVARAVRQFVRRAHARSLGDKRLFAERMGRKLKSLKHGLVNVENNFWVFSPVACAGSAAGRLTNWALGAADPAGGAPRRHPPPVALGALPGRCCHDERIPHAAIVMQRTDRFEAFPEGDPEIVASRSRL